jgi:hypothetical protein
VHNAKRHECSYTESNFAESNFLSVVMLSVVILSVVMPSINMLRTVFVESSCADTVMPSGIMVTDIASSYILLFVR